jgi:hypothetical protein
MSDLQILQDLHDSEINGEIAWLYDGAWRVCVGGDPVDGYAAEVVVENLAEAVEWLRTEAIRRYPDSEFAKSYGHGFV